MMCGGTSEEKEATPDIQELCDKVIEDNLQSIVLLSLTRRLG